ncbi:carbonic anhydrase [Bacteroidota bacterium]
MERTIPVSAIDDIQKKYRHTPIEELLAYQNLNRVFDNYKNAKLLIGTCMDNRISLQIPKNFAFVIRTAGVNLQNLDFNISYAISVGKLKYIAIIGHDNCGMVDLPARKDVIINGLIENAGWNRSDATDHYNNYSSQFEIYNEIDFVIKESKRLQQKFPKILVAPLMFALNDNKLYQIKI